jgi:hypothetical protein
MQNLKAVTMGVVTARTLFWSNKPNPATAPFVISTSRTQVQQPATHLRLRTEPLALACGHGRHTPQ